MASDEVTGLGALLGSQQEEVDVQSEVEDAATVLLMSINQSLEERDKRINQLTGILGKREAQLKAQAFEIKMLGNRVSTLETFVSFLLERHPDLLQKVKDMEEAEKVAVGAGNNGNAEG